MRETDEFGPPYLATNGMAARPFARRPVIAVLALLCLIEGVLFLVPKGAALLGSPADWAVLSLWENPLREQVFADFAFHPATSAAAALADPLAYFWMGFTAIFLHAGLVHLLFNGSALIAFGPLPALRMGFGRFIAFFVCAGIAGFLLHLMIRGILRDSEVPAVGASGAIMGLLGYHWRVIYDRTARKRPSARPLLVTPNNQLRRQVFAFLWADLLFILTASFISGEAHIGGLIFGFLAAPLFTRTPKAHRRWLRRMRRGATSRSDGIEVSP